MEEIKIETAQQMLKRTNESEKSFKRLVKNLMGQIKDMSDEGDFDLNINFGGVFRDRVISLLRDNGYKVEIDKSTYIGGPSNDGNWIIIQWGEDAIESED